MNRGITFCDLVMLAFIIVLLFVSGISCRSVSLHKSRTKEQHDSSAVSKFDSSGASVSMVSKQNYAGATTIDSTGEYRSDDVAITFYQDTANNYAPVVVTHTDSGFVINAGGRPINSVTSKTQKNETKTRSATTRQASKEQDLQTDSSNVKKNGAVHVVDAVEKESKVKKTTGPGLWVLVAVPVAIVALVVLWIFFYLRKKKQADSPIKNVNV